MSAASGTSDPSSLAEPCIYSQEHFMVQDGHWWSYKLFILWPEEEMGIDPTEGMNCPAPHNPQYHPQESGEY